MKADKSIKEFVINILGNSIGEKIYASLAGAGGLSILVQFIGSLLPESQSSIVASTPSGPIFWQILIALLVLVSHGQKNFAEMDKENTPALYYFWRFIEAIGITASFFFVGLIFIYDETRLPFAFFGLSVMLFSIIFRRALTDSNEPGTQIFRFISACWFVLVGIWILQSPQEENLSIMVFSGFLFVLYIALIYTRYNKT